MVYIRTLSYRRLNAVPVVNVYSLSKTYLDYRNSVKHKCYSTNVNVLPKSCKVAICGGGIMGASVAYHLAQLGWGPHTLLVEQGKLGGGKNLYSADLVGVFKPTLGQVKLCQSSVDLYKQLESQGFNTGWKQCGSLCVARTRDRMNVFRRMKSQSVSWGIDCELVDPNRAKQLCPLIKIDDIKGALWIPGDGVADSYLTCISLLEAAKQKGVTVVENCKLLEVVCDGRKVVAIDTTMGSVECDHYVNCGGFWARKIGQLSNPVVKVPLHPVEHYYLRTKPIPNLDPLTPVVRDQDGYIYFREMNGCILAGGFEPEGKPTFEDSVCPETMEERQLLADWDHFHVLFEQMLHRVPSLANATLDNLVNVAETFSPDCKWIAGRAPEV